MLWESSFVTGNEMVRFVDRACAMWNIDASKQRKADLCNAWMLVLHDLTYESCEKALVAASVAGETFLPKPGDIRRRVLAPSEGAPAPLEAWLQLQSLLKSATSGTAATAIHPLVAATLKRLGGGYGLHTNGDRDAFCQVYEKVVAEHEATLYAVKDKNEQG